MPSDHVRFMPTSAAPSARRERRAFAIGGHIRWEIALPMAVCNVAGSQIGTRLAIAKGAPFVRKLFLFVVTALLVRMTWEVAGG